VRSRHPPGLARASFSSPLTVGDTPHCYCSLPFGEAWFLSGGSLRLVPGGSQGMSMTHPFVFNKQKIRDVGGARAPAAAWAPAGLPSALDPPPVALAAPASKVQALRISALYTYESHESSPQMVRQCIAGHGATCRVRPYAPRVGGPRTRSPRTLPACPLPEWR
jgi:hypothetical protein